MDDSLRVDTFIPFILVWIRVDTCMDGIYAYHAPGSGGGGGGVCVFMCKRVHPGVFPN